MVTPARRRRLLIGAFIGLVFFCIYSFNSSRTTQAAVEEPRQDEPLLQVPLQDAPHTASGPLPPTWDYLREWERNLPQHDTELPVPEGRHGRYVSFSNQIQGLGWNNQLNEVLMLAHLAYKANRSYVFRDYSWNLDHIPWSKEQLRKVYHGQHPTTPANALLAGPAVGGMWPPGDPAPRSVSTEWFNIVCPPERRRKITTEAIKAPIRWEKGDVHFRTWLKVLAEAPEECIEIIGSSEDSFPQLFDVYVWGSDRVLPLWEDFRDSPVSQLQRPSHIVTSAVEKNKPLFLPRGPKPKDIVSIDPFDRMLAIHIRRGDYKNACVHFGTWNVSFYGWNQLPYLSDRFQHPAGWTWGKNTPENMDIFMKQCYPDDDFILKKIRAAKWDYEQAAKAGEKRLLDVLFLMTNEKAEWQAKITKMLRAEGWGTVVTTKDLRLDSEQHEVGMVVDMELARKAAVFIGNGWSSFTSSITHRRLVDKREYYANRFF